MNQPSQTTARAAARRYLEGELRIAKRVIEPRALADAALCEGGGSWTSKACAR